MAASPQNPDPRKRDNVHPIGDARRVDREVGGGTRFGSAWIWIGLLILAFIIAIVWFGGFGWAGHGGWWSANRSIGLQQTVAHPSGPGLAALAATNKQSFIGGPFDVRGVPVHTVVNDHALWIGENNGTSMLVVLTGANNTVANANIAQGDPINVTGTVQKAPNAATAKKQWSLTDDDTNILEKQGAYIQATAVRSGQP